MALKESLLPAKKNKLTIKPAGLPDITVLFNPNSYSIVKPVKWDSRQTNKGLNAPELDFGGGQGRTLSLELFFDVTEPLDDGREIKDVRELTSSITALTRKVGEGAPPICEILWGNAPFGSPFPFKGVVTNLTERFTHFRNITAEPVRANLTVAFLEYLKAVDDKKATDPELTTRVVRRGDTVTTIAAEFYRDAALWRVIAQANGLDDPRRLDREIGRVLTIPKLR